MWQRVCVGAGLLAIAVCQPTHLLLIDRYREQARSHNFDPVPPDISLFTVAEQL